MKEIKKNLKNTLNTYYLPELGEARRGKVRDNYPLKEKKRLMIATDRVSCFDHILRQQIPFKGQVLTKVAEFWFSKTKDIIENHLISCPDPNAMLVKECEPLPVEVVVRGYLAGSAWRAYKAGKREFCGIKLPEGMKENQRFDNPILTPTTKAEEGHDEDTSAEEIIRKNIVQEKIWKQIEAAAIKLFIRGQEICKGARLVLVDTKYEFGLYEGKLMLIDEMHTPDSSRFWDMGEEGKAHRSKEFVRAWLIKKGFMGKDGEDMPDLTDDVVAETAQIYIELCEKITGEAFCFKEADIAERLCDNLTKAGIIRGFFVPVLMGSGSDKDFSNRITKKLEELDIASAMHVASAHKTPEKVLEIVNRYNHSTEPIVYITVAGRSNGLSGVTAGSSVHPVIACPPFKDRHDYLVNIHSTLQMPSETPVLTVIDPKNAALAAARIFSNSSAAMKKRAADRIQKLKSR